MEPQMNTMPAERQVPETNDETADTVRDPTCPFPGAEEDAPFTQPSGGVTVGTTHPS